MMLIKVGQANNPMVERDLNWCLGPILVPMRCIGVHFDSSTRTSSRWRFLANLYRFSLLAINTTLQMILLYSLFTPFLDNYHSRSLTRTKTKKLHLDVLKVDIGMYVITNVLGHVILLLDVRKHWAPLLKTYQRIESRYRVNLNCKIRRLSIIGLFYVSTLVNTFFKPKIM